MNMSDIVNIIIAALALVIAIIQFIAEMRKRKENKWKKQYCAELDDMAREYKSTIDEFKTKMEYVNVLNIETKKEFVKNEREGKWADRDRYSFYLKYFCSIKEICNNITVLTKNMIESSEKMLNILLKCESEFSLSYGFGRYIELTREASFGIQAKSYILVSSDFSKYVEEAINSLQNDIQRDNGLWHVTYYYLALICWSGEPGILDSFSGQEEFRNQAKEDYQKYYSQWFEETKAFVDKLESTYPLYEEMELKFRLENDKK